MRWIAFKCANICKGQGRINITWRWILRAIKEVLNKAIRKSLKIFFFLFWLSAFKDLYDLWLFHENPLKKTQNPLVCLGLIAKSSWNIDMRIFCQRLRIITRWKEAPEARLWITCILIHISISILQQKIQYTSSINFSFQFLNRIERRNDYYIQST